MRMMMKMSKMVIGTGIETGMMWKMMRLLLVQYLLVSFVRLLLVLRIVLTLLDSIVV